MGKKRRRRPKRSSNAALFWIIGIFSFLIIGGGVTWLLVKKTAKAADADHSQDDSKVSHSDRPIGSGSDPPRSD
jgi:hypothetical protein